MNSLFYFLFVAAALIFGAFFISVKSRRRKGRFFQALGFVLYEVILPREEKIEPARNFKEVIAVMEQFYNGMSSLGTEGRLFWKKKSYFVLELALPSVGLETSFFAAVPRRHQRLFEKQVNAFFPHAQAQIKNEDYNVFNVEGVNGGGYFTLSETSLFPTRTYKNLDADPLEIVVNAFSKLKEEGEGAALQIIVSPLPLKNKFSAWFKQSLNKIQKRERVLLRPKNFWGMAFGSLSAFFSGSAPAKKEQPEQIDEGLKKLVEEKASSRLMLANIRLVASAKDGIETARILQELESAFSQFSEPQGNSFKFIGLSPKKLPDFFYKFSFRMFDESTAIPLNVSELTSVCHFPVGMISAPNLKFLKAKNASPPANLPKEGIVLGKNIFRGKETEVRLRPDDRRRHLYVVGQTGTGKTVFLKNMIIQDIREGKGVAVIDPHGDLVGDILAHIPKSRLEEVVYFDPGNVARPTGLNFLEYDPGHPEQKTFIVNELLEIFNKLYNMSIAGGPMFEQYFRNATMLVMDDPESGNTLLEVERVLVQKSFRDYKLSRSRNPVIKSFWQEIAEKAGGEASLQNMTPYITSKFDTFLTNEIMRPIIIQEHSAFRFREVMDEGKILLINLSKGRLGELNAALLGLIIVGRILMAALSRVDISEENRRDFYLYIDEFHNVTTKSIATILSEARKYRLNLIMSHQFIGQLEEEIKKAVFGNVGSIAAFRVGAEDAEFLVKQFEPVFNAHDLLNIDNYNAYLKLLIDGQTSRPFNIKTLPSFQGDASIKETAVNLSILKYGRPREEVEEEIREKYRQQLL